MRFGSMNTKALFLILCLSPMSLLAITTQPKGLTNIGNSCCLAASLQALYAMDDLVEAVRAKRDFYKPNTITSNYLGLLNQVIDTDERTFRPEALFNRAWDLIGAPRKTQQDAGEFLFALLNSLADADILDPVRNNMPLYPNSPRVQNDLSMLFYTLTNVQIRHEETNFESEPRTEGFAGLTVPLDKTDRRLSECLDFYFRPAPVDFRLPDDTYVEAQSSRTLVETQDYFIVGLQRNHPVIDVTTGEQALNPKTKAPLFERRDNPLSFPLQGLDLSPYFENRANAGSTYDLIAVIMHRGNGAGGHYSSYIRKGHWYLCNDAVIRRVSDQQMEQIAARGYGVDQETIPTLFIYERSAAVAHKAPLHRQIATIIPEPVAPAAAKAPAAQSPRPQTTAPQFGASGTRGLVRNVQPQTAPARNNLVYQPGRQLGRQPGRTSVQSSPYHPVATTRPQAQPAIRQPQQRRVVAQKPAAQRNAMAAAAIMRRAAQPQRKVARKNGMPSRGFF